MRIVKLSGTNAGIRPDGPDACRQHWQVEQYLASGRTPCVILRPNAFMQGLLAGLAASAVATGTIANPLGAAGLSMVDCADIGEAAAAEVLTDPRTRRQDLCADRSGRTDLPRRSRATSATSSVISHVNVPSRPGRPAPCARGAAPPGRPGT